MATFFIVMRLGGFFVSEPCKLSTVLDSVRSFAEQTRLGTLTCKALVAGVLGKAAVAGVVGGFASGPS